MYAKILNNAVVKYPYQWTDFEDDNNNTNYGYTQPDILTVFPETDIAKQGYTVVSVASAAQPAITYQESIAEGTPTLVNNLWTQNWVVTQLTADQIASKTTSQAASVRQQRDAKLADCDWTQVADAPVDKAAWATYRQALRDLPKEAGFPWDMTWPTEPKA